MRTKLIAIGNSKGIRLPKAVIEQCGLEEELELEPHAGHLILRSARSPRAGWAEAFRRMHEQGDDALLDPGADAIANEWDETGWTW